MRTISGKDNYWYILRYKPWLVLDTLNPITHSERENVLVTSGTLEVK